MKSEKHYVLLLGIALLALAMLSACSSTKRLSHPMVDVSKLGGGSSGMEQVNDSTYLAVYDVKNYVVGLRTSLIIVSDEAINVYPIKIDLQDKEGVTSDLESVCAIPGRPGEYLVAESGSWIGERGRVFHIQVDVDSRTGRVLGSFRIPILHGNDWDNVGDQYEAIHCLALNDKKRIVLLGERGGSEIASTGIFRWGLWDITTNTFELSPEGKTGLSFDAPGNWTDSKAKRSITDMHVDVEGVIWASACEDVSDAGPFYSVIYKLGKVNPNNSKTPVVIFDSLTVAKEVNGFKIEALSGPPKAISCTHSFGTEDEMYGGVWRPIRIDAGI